MIIIGITGSIGMGKSTIAKMLEKLKIPVFDSDKEVKNLLENNDIVKNKIYKIWPDVISYESKTKIINKLLLSDKIFTNKMSRELLEKIIHPLVKQKRDTYIKIKRKSLIVALDIPLLYETGSYKICHDIFLAYTSEKNQRKRVLARPNMTEKRFNLIKNTQWDNEKKKSKNPYLVVTSYGKFVTFVTIITYLLLIIIKRKLLKL